MENSNAWANWTNWAIGERKITCAYEQERNERWMAALEQIASVPLLGEEGALKLDGKDAEGFIHIARRALGLEG